MRVLHIVGDSAFGGGSVMILSLAQATKAQDWDTDVLTTDSQLGAALSEAGISWVNLPVIRRRINPWTDLIGLTTLTRYLKSHPYTVVHTHTTKAGFIGRLAARWAGVPIVVHTAHGFAFHEESSKLKICCYAALERLASSCCDAVITVSRFHRDWGLRLRMGRSEKWVVIPNGVSEPHPVLRARVAMMRQSWGATPETLVVLTHGRLAADKGLEQLIQAARSLKRRLRSPFLVLFAGEGPLRSKLARMIESLEVQDQVRLLGFRPDVTELLAAADMVALPSLREGLSIALLEAMAMARPIIASAIGSNREVTREGAAALLIPPGSCEALEQAVAYLADHPEKAQCLARRAREIYREEYTVDRMLACYHRLYLDLLAKRNLVSVEPVFTTAAQ